MLNPVFRQPPAAYSITVEWTAPPTSYPWNGYDYYLWDVERKLAAGASGTPPGGTIPLRLSHRTANYPYPDWSRRPTTSSVSGRIRILTLEPLNISASMVSRAPDITQVPVPITVLVLECLNDRVTVVWGAPTAETDLELVRFDYTWAGGRSATGTVPVVPPLQLVYSTNTNIYQAGDVVEFSVSAIYRVGDRYGRVQFLHQRVRSQSPETPVRSPP